MVPHEPSTATLQPALFLKSLSAKRGDGGFYDSHGVRLNFIKKSPTLPPQCKGRNIRGSTLLALINAGLRTGLGPLRAGLPICSRKGTFSSENLKQLLRMFPISGSSLWVRSAQVLVSSTLYIILLLFTYSIPKRPDCKVKFPRFSDMLPAKKHKNFPLTVA